MTKFEFLNTLKTALHGLPADKVERTVAEYERRFEQGSAAGRSEEDIARELGDPWDIAAQVRLPTRERAANGAAKAGRVFISGVGLAVFNLFMIIPTFLYGILLMVLYIVALVSYFGGIFLTASSLSGVEEVAFRMPFEQVVIDAPNTRHAENFDRLRIRIGEDGIQIQHENDEEEDAGTADTAGAPQANAPAAAASAPNASTPAASTPSTSTADASTAGTSTTGQSKATATVFVDEGDDRGLQTLRGIGVILGGILLLLLCAVVTKYTWIGMKRYIQMNISVLRNA
ncbi:MAG TPA: DUF1700 domain-containing protein [Paucimonas sp.]|nr:DUF1700 domain-containing protein [Paucimonas sp.]